MRRRRLQRVAEVPWGTTVDTAVFLIETGDEQEVSIPEAKDFYMEGFEENGVSPSDLDLLDQLIEEDEFDLDYPRIKQILVKYLSHPEVYAEDPEGWYAIMYSLLVQTRSASRRRLRKASGGTVGALFQSTFGRAMSSVPTRWNSSDVKELEAIPLARNNEDFGYYFADVFRTTKDYLSKVASITSFEINGDIIHDVDEDFENNVLRAVVEMVGLAHWG